MATRSILALLVVASMAAACAAEPIFAATAAGVIDDAAQLDAIDEASIHSNAIGRSLLSRSAVLSAVGPVIETEATTADSNTVTPGRALLAPRTYASVATAPSKPKNPSFKTSSTRPATGRRLLATRDLLAPRTYASVATVPAKPKNPSFKTSSTRPAASTGRRALLAMRDLLAPRTYASVATAPAKPKAPKFKSSSTARP